MAWRVGELDVVCLGEIMWFVLNLFFFYLRARLLRAVSLESVVAGAGKIRRSAAHLSYHMHREKRNGDDAFYVVGTCGGGGRQQRYLEQSPCSDFSAPKHFFLADTAERLNQDTNQLRQLLYQPS